MPRQKENAPTVESQRVGQKTDTSLTPWTPEAQIAIFTLFLLYFIAATIIEVMA